MKQFDQAGRRLAEAMAAAFRPYLDAKTRERGYPSLDKALLEMTANHLKSELTELLGQPASVQRRSPLQVFQAAFSEPNRLLAELGTEPPARDPMAVRALPGDLYDLAPVSSSELGEAVWEAHLAWGLAKAAAVKNPVAVLLTANLMDRSRLEPIFDAHGLELETADTFDRFEDLLAQSPAQVVIDLTHPASEEAVAASAAFRVVAYGPHVDEDAMARARMLGANDVLTRSSFFRQSGWIVGGSV